MRRYLLAPLVLLAAVFAACEGDAVPGASSPLVNPYGPTASPTSTAVIIPGAEFARDTIRVLPNGGFASAIDLRVELPMTNAAYQQGLMGRPPLPDTEGMLFVMARRPVCSFWMKDTPSPLTIAFADADGRIIDIQDMEPFSLDTHDPGRPCAYALEMARGWFERHGVRAGDFLRFPWPANQPPPYPTER